MKKINKLLTLFLPLLLFTACYDRDIVDQKDFNFSLPQVENLSYTRSGGEVTLTWQIPGTISQDFNRPVNVVVQRIVNNIYGERRVLQGEQTRTSFAAEPGTNYRYVVRLEGFLTPDAKVEGFPDRVLSEGVIIEID